MSRFLINEVLTFRCDMEQEAIQLIESIKSRVDVVSHEIRRIEKKDDIYFRVVIKTKINDIKNPTEAYLLD